MRSERICSIDGCERPHAARGWCKLHYYRWKRNGDPNLKSPPLPICQVPGCTTVGRRVVGLCNIHYRRVRRIGSFDLPSRDNLLWDKIQKTDTCWLWLAYCDQDGYGRWTPLRTRKPRPAHRVVYELLVGPIPEGLELDHLCRVRNCVNPDHLEPVTTRENVLRSKAHLRGSSL